jgi:hypothetical protein
MIPHLVLTRTPAIPMNQFKGFTVHFGNSEFEQDRTPQFWGVFDSGVAPR